MVLARKIEQFDKTEIVSRGNRVPAMSDVGAVDVSINAIFGPYANDVITKNTKLNKVKYRPECSYRNQSYDVKDRIIKTIDN